MRSALSKGMTLKKMPEGKYALISSTDLFTIHVETRTLDEIERYLNEIAG